MLLLSEHLIDRLGPDDLPTLRGLLAAGHLGDSNSRDWFCVKVLDKRRFAQTSAGWGLRELSKAQPDDVRAFLTTHGDAMSAEARRAASARL